MQRTCSICARVVNVSGGREMDDPYTCVPCEMERIRAAVERARAVSENAWADERDQMRRERDEARAERDKALDERDAAEASRETQWQRAEKAARTLRENVLGEPYNTLLARAEQAERECGEWHDLYNAAQEIAQSAERERDEARAAAGEISAILDLDYLLPEERDSFVAQVRALREVAEAAREIGYLQHGENCRGEQGVSLGYPCRCGARADKARLDTALAKVLR